MFRALAALALGAAAVAASPLGTASARAADAPPPQGRLSIEVVDAATGASRPLLQRAGANGVLLPLGFGADGALRVMRSGPRATDALAVGLDGTIAGGPWKWPALGTDPDVVASPDGGRVALMRDTQRGLEVLELESGTPRSIAALAWVSNLAWAADGRRLAVVGMPRGAGSPADVGGGAPQALLVLDAGSGAKLFRRPEPSEFIGAMAWGTGPRIVVSVAGEGTGDDLLSVEPATGRVGRRRAPDRTMLGAAWSLDGATLATIGVGSYAPWQIRLLPEGVRPGRVLESPPLWVQRLSVPVWSPDGSRLAFVATRATGRHCFGAARGRRPNRRHPAADAVGSPTADQAAVGPGRFGDRARRG